MIKKIGLGVGVVLVLFLGYVAMQPADYVISREVTIHASADRIFPLMNSVKLADQWGPWKEVDPDAKMSYSGPDVGVGAKESWESKGQLGTGSATIVESTLNQRVAIALEYTEPMSMSQYSEYLLQPKGDQTVVTWRVKGKNGFPFRILCVFMNMDKKVGGFFEQGLAKLKRIIETKA